MSSNERTKLTISAMKEAFLTFINGQQLLAANQRVLLAVSGGLDSMVMATLFGQCNVACGVAHCNFGLRGEAANGDEAFVRAWAEARGWPFVSVQFDTKAYAEAQGVSIQMAARTLRYEWLAQCRQVGNYDWIATAHHQDDVVETLLLNLTKGTGIAGLHGIKPKKDTLIRPMLFATRAQIEAFAATERIPWREDASNASEYYQRNLLRHRVVPILKQINPSATHSIAQTALRMAATERVYQRAVAAQRQAVWRAVGDVVRLSIEQVLALDEPLLMLYEWLRPLGFGYETCEQVLVGRGQASGAEFFSESHWLVRDRTEWVIVPRREVAEPIKVDAQAEEIRFGAGMLRFTNGQNATQKADIQTIEVDADRLQFPLELRVWQRGDTFCPKGMQGRRKKVSDLLVEHKVPRNLKPRTYVLTSGGQIVWVLGLRADERYRVRPDTQRVMCLEWHA
jgi:tRNA(Ile)-lysidine synthase